MSESNKLKTITDQIKTQFENIDETGDYNNNIIASHIVKGYVEFAAAIAYPSIYIAGVRDGASEQADQIMYNVPVIVEIFGYVNKENDLLDVALELASDMENAIYADETLDDNVWSMSLDLEIAAFESYGVVKMILSAVTDYTV